ncbi:Fascin-3 [Manis pentadactyla]|nr:Fascin-3 [Manis pentadactyla]
MADGHQLESDTFFCMHWNCGRIILQSPNGRFLGIIANGLLMANASIPGPNEEFGIQLANRPFLSLRGQYRYVGTSAEHDLMQCNMDQPHCIHLLPCHQGIYHFQGQCNAAYQDPNPPGETTAQNRTETQVKTHEKNICYTACPTQFSKTPVSSNNTSQRATPKSWCASDSVQIRGLDVGGY